MEITGFAALIAGLLSFVSPCVLPLVPAYISFMTGLSVDQLRQEEAAHNLSVELKAGLNSVAFVLGFSTVFVILGLSATVLGKMLLAYLDILSKIGGVLIILFGLHFMGLFRIALLDRDVRFNPMAHSPGVVKAFLVGLAFAFGWTPCIGPILATILTLAGTQETLLQGTLLLVIYSAGLGIPFIVAGLAIHRFLAFFERIRRHLHTVEIISGVFLVVMGVLIFMGDLSRFATILIEWFPTLATVG